MPLRKLRSDPVWKHLQSDGKDTGPGLRVPTYEHSVFLAQIESLHDSGLDDYELARAVAFAVDEHQMSSPHDVQSILRASHYMALIAQKDMSWKTELAGEHRSEVITALENELRSLESTILTRINPGDPLYDIAVELATAGKKNGGRLRRQWGWVASRSTVLDPPDGGIRFGAASQSDAAYYRGFCSARLVTRSPSTDGDFVNC